MKKENKNEVGFKKESSVKEKQNKQVKIILIIIILILGSVIIVPFLIKYFNSFDYIGLKFEKTKIGKIKFFSTKIPLTKKVPSKDSFVSLKDVTDYYDIKFRNDPRELEKIFTNVSEEGIKFIKNNPVYISIYYDVPICEDNLISVVGLTDFLERFGGLYVKGAINGKENSSDNLIIDCKNSTFNTVIIVKNNSETSINQKSKNCYELNYRDCEILKATEKFEIMIIKKYMEYFKI